ncbi:hypothetical protein LR69_00095 [Geobacillus sp. BCO2]|nr:hypothetical protein LR69_00095 [Geobacillus sp. BCO2]
MFRSKRRTALLIAGLGAGLALYHAGQTAWAAPAKQSKPPEVKNVILFVGDGMGTAHRNAIRLATKGIAGELEMDDMPYSGLSIRTPPTRSHSSPTPLRRRPRSPQA